MPGYVIAQIKVRDVDEYRNYLAGFMEVFTPFEGKVLVATDEVEVLEGSWPEGRTVVMEFPSVEKAREWYQSAQYQQVAQHRLRSATTDMILIDGFSGHYAVKS
jgi:uncharacterized protein (DUF1330 family)